MAIPEGTKVRLVSPVIEGVVADQRFNKSAQEIEYRVPYLGADGEEHEGWFIESKLMVVKEDAPVDGEVSA